MKKYLFIYKSELMSSLQYVFNIFTSFISFFIMIFIFLNLWTYIYSNPNELINGYSMNQMVWYVIITEILWMTLGGRKLCNTISNDVRSGNIAYNINKPYSYIGYSLSNHLGSITLRLVIYIILGITLGFIFLGSFPELSILSIISVLITGILSLVLSILLIVIIGLFSFYIEDSGPFYWVYSKFILILGTIFPIEFFPKIVTNILKFSPIFAISYGPAKLFVDFTLKNAIITITVQIIYIIIAYLLCNLVYSKGVKRLNVNGG